VDFEAKNASRKGYSDSGLTQRRPRTAPKEKPLASLRAFLCVFAPLPEALFLALN
jgi:hypothetical protein